jgi:peroxiredoxin
MKNRIGIISVVAASAIAAIIFLVVAYTPSSESAAGGITAASAGGPSSETTVEDAYATLTTKMQALENKARAARSMDEKVDVLNELEVLLAEFIDEYDESPQAAQVSFEAGMVNFSLQNPKKAIRYLENFLQNAIEPERDKQAYSHFYLGEAYKQVGEYDDAEAEYKTVLNSFGDVDRSLSGMVQQNLSMLANERKLKIGSPPIGFEVTSTQGKKLSLEQYKGKVVLLDFWATWCAPCRQEMPNVRKVYDKYNPKGFEIVGISLDKSREALDSYVEKYEVKWPQYFDGKFWQNEVATLYGIKSIPSTFLIDKKGNIRYKSLRGHQLEAAVKELLDE